MSGSIRVFQVSEQCECKRGHRSRIDGKCEFCRSTSDVNKLEAFWKEATDKDIHANSWDFKYLRRKHYGGLYEFT